MSSAEMLQVGIDPVDSKLPSICGVPVPTSNEDRIDALDSSIFFAVGDGSQARCAVAATNVVSSGLPTEAVSEDDPDVVPAHILHEARSGRHDMAPALVADLDLTPNSITRLSNKYAMDASSNVGHDIISPGGSLADVHVVLDSFFARCGDLNFCLLFVALSCDIDAGLEKTRLGQPDFALTYSRFTRYGVVARLAMLTWLVEAAGIAVSSSWWLAVAGEQLILSCWIGYRLSSEDLAKDAGSRSRAMLLGSCYGVDLPKMLWPATLVRGQQDESKTPMHMGANA
ncbi:hypothetical protein Nepgr_002887 [Nepenthes gracilis]|uniref:Uncharacterized protein n=1 Tax=Nepenthes gracilis TaxID=150966 RepID=A0AAD3P7T8_NEPGR|nr:hypothetical protein Nepgr_002887 [Nepenthes gracilis]